MADVASVSEVLDKVTSAVTEVAKTYGPQAADVAIEATRYLCITDLIQGAFLGLLAGGFALGTNFFIKMAVAWAKANEGTFNDSEILPVLCAIGTGAGCIFTSIGSLVHLLSAKTWIGVFEPKMFLAMKVMDKVIN